MFTQVVPDPTYVIHKHVLDLVDDQIIDIDGPVERFLSVDNQRGNLCLWTLNAPDDHIISHAKIRIVGTGHKMYEDEPYYKFLGTVVIEPLVWHVFLEGVEIEDLDIGDDEMPF